MVSWWACYLEHAAEDEVMQARPLLLHRQLVRLTGTRAHHTNHALKLAGTTDGSSSTTATIINSSRGRSGGPYLSLWQAVQHRGPGPGTHGQVWPQEGRAVWVSGCPEQCGGGLCAEEELGADPGVLAVPRVQVARHWPPASPPHTSQHQHNNHNKPRYSETQRARPK